MHGIQQQRVHTHTALEHCTQLFTKSAAVRRFTHMTHVTAHTSARSLPNHMHNAMHRATCPAPANEASLLTWAPHDCRFLERAALHFTASGRSPATPMCSRGGAASFHVRGGVALSQPFLGVLSTFFYIFDGQTDGRTD